MNRRVVSATHIGLGAPTTSTPSIRHSSASTEAASTQPSQLNGAVRSRTSNAAAGALQFRNAHAARSSSSSSFLLDVDQHNTSSVALSPRAAPRRRSRAVSPAVNTSLLDGQRQHRHHDILASTPAVAGMKRSREDDGRSKAQARNGGLDRLSVSTAGGSSFSTQGSYTAAGNGDGQYASRVYHDSQEADMLSDGDAEEGSTEISCTLMDRMRIWRNDALNQHLYTTAIFWGSKVFTKTREPNDGFWLAQSYFAAGMYSRAQRVLTNQWPIGSDTPETLANDRRALKGKQREALDDAAINGPASEARSAAPTVVGYADSQTSTVQARPIGLHDKIAQQLTELICLADTSVACRYLAAQCMIRQEKWTAAMDMLGEINPFRDLHERGPTHDKSDQESGDGGIKFEASMCHLRGLVQLHLNAMDRAKECFLEALSIDAKCYNSFDALISGNMLDIAEEWALINGMSYASHTPEDADFIRMMYTIRIKKSAHREEIERCSQALMQDYGLSNDPDVLFGLADELYTSMRYSDCFSVTTKILQENDSHAATLPLHLACMQHLPHLRSQLFLLAHELVDREPESVVSWYAVGLWYYASSRWEEARRYLGKALLIDNRFGPAWLSFAHSFALEGEHDQAITAYSTAQRHLQGSHMPVMFIGMQYILLSNIKAAEEYLDMAYSLCQTDPLLLNEKGVAAYYNERYAEAINFFSSALRHAEAVQASPTSWASTHLNMGHAYRKLGQFEQAHHAFKQVLQLQPASATAHAAVGMVMIATHRYDIAIDSLHKALSLEAGEPTFTSLLNLALEQSAQVIYSAKGESMKFPRLSSVAADELDRRVYASDMEIFGRVVSADAGAATVNSAYQEAMMARMDTNDGAAATSRVKRTFSRPGSTRQDPSQRNSQEENENNGSYEASAMMEASQNSDMVD